LALPVALDGVVDADEVPLPTEKVRCALYVAGADAADAGAVHTASVVAVRRLIM
jgi:hypothetical protein